MLSLLRGLRQLATPEVVRHLGETRLRMKELGLIRQQFRTSRISTDVKFVNHHPQRLELGDRSHICDGTVLAFGDEGNGFGCIKIGSQTWIGQYNNLRASGGADIVIGSKCLISQFCTLVGTNHKIGRHTPIIDQGPDQTRCGITLEDDVWLGAGVVVLPGITIAQGAVIGANAVVSRNVPPFEIHAGVPARKIGERPECE